MTGAIQDRSVVTASKATHLLLTNVCGGGSKGPESYPFGGPFHEFPGYAYAHPSGGSELHVSSAAPGERRLGYSKWANDG
jgi:hypothetical protein